MRSPSAAIGVSLCLFIFVHTGGRAAANQLGNRQETHALRRMDVRVRPAFNDGLVCPSYSLHSSKELLTGY
jgi:hypothetical protein